MHTLREPFMLTHYVQEESMPHVSLFLYVTQYIWIQGQFFKRNKVMTHLFTNCRI